MIFVVADIHGELKKLKKLIDYILLIDNNPSFVFIGDYLDKGESPFEVLKYLVELSKCFDSVFLMGNHEYIWLNLHKDYKKHSKYLKKYGGYNTVDSFNCTTLEQTLTEMIKQFSGFMYNLKNYWINDKYVVTHSGILPSDFNTPIEDIPIERLIFNRYDFIKHQHLYLDKYKVIFGHTGFYNPYQDPFKIGIDTSACYIEEQPLTAICIDNSYFYNSNEEAIKVDIKDSSSCPVIPRVKPWRLKYEI